MRLLFLSIGDFPSIRHREIYPDLLREFMRNGHEVFVVCSRERREKLSTEMYVEDGAKLLKVHIGNITKTNMLEKGVSTLLIGKQYKAAIMQYFPDVGKSAFACRYGLTSISLPESLEIIDDEAFYGCKALSSIRLPDGVSEMGIYPFIGCYALKTIELSDSNPYFEIKGGGLYSKTDKKLISVFDWGKDRTFYVQEGTAIIGKNAFGTQYGYSYNVFLPESVSLFESENIDELYYDSSEIFFVVQPGSIAEQSCIKAGCSYGHELPAG